MQPFSLTGRIRFLGSYCGPHQFLWDEILFILLKNKFLVVTQQIWTICCRVSSSVWNHQQHAGDRLIEKDETYDIMKSLNSVKRNLFMHIVTPSLSWVHWCDAWCWRSLQIFGTFAFIELQATRSSNDCLAIDLCAFLCNILSLKKIVRNNRCFQKVKWSSRRVRQGSDASLELNFYKSLQDRFRHRLFFMPLSDCRSISSSWRWSGLRSTTVLKGSLNILKSLSRFRKSEKWSPKTAHNFLIIVPYFS